MIMGASMGTVVDNVIPQHLESLTAKMREMGIHIETSSDQILVATRQLLKPQDIKDALVYPGFPADSQQPFTTLLTRASGTSVVTDTIYGAWFKHIDELETNECIC